MPFEVDLSFADPTEPADSIYFNVFMPKFAVPPAHGTKLITATCEDGNLGFECPISPDEKHTLKSTLFIDSKAQCTGNCEGLGAGGGTVRRFASIKNKMIFSHTSVLSRIVMHSTCKLCTQLQSYCLLTVYIFYVACYLILFSSE